MSGTRLCQLLAEWAAEDRAMSDMYESISFDDIRSLLQDSRTNRVERPTSDSTDEVESVDARR